MVRAQDDRLTIAEVGSRAAARAFLELPWRLYRTDPLWVAPLRGSERSRWDAGRNPALGTRRVTRFLARRGRRVVGRIAAIIDPAFAQWERDTGFFGFFECENDTEAACALFATAEAWLSRAGMRQVLGPVNLSTHDEVGLLTDGFTTAPTLLSPYNPPYYTHLIETAGYEAQREYLAYTWTPACEPSPVLLRVLRRAAHGAAAAGVHVRAFDPSRWDHEVDTLFELYHAAFDGVWGFVPMQRQEFEQRAREFRQFYRPELIAIAEHEGRAVGFGLILPDINESLRPLHGRLLPLGWWHLMRSVPRLRTARFVLLGVHPTRTGRGVAAQIASRLEAAGRALGIHSAELSLVQSANTRMRRVIEAFGCQPTRRYRLYARACVPRS